MKRINLILISVFISVLAWGQEVVARYENSATGLYNERTQQWVVRPQYAGVNYLGSYNGYHYYNVCTIDKLWGVICSKNFHQYVLSPNYQECYRGGGGDFSSIPLVVVKQKGDYGIVALAPTASYRMYPTSYKNVYINDYAVTLQTWENKLITIDMKDVKKRYADLIQAAKDAEKRKKEAEFEEAKRKSKEKELSSFTLYAKNRVTPYITQWQQKGEFEKIADYQVRVTGSNRQRIIDSLTQVVEQQFIEEWKTLNPLSGMLLNTYDSENEVFSITSSRFGDLVVPVPIQEGAHFKNNFSHLSMQDAVYYVENDHIALRSVNFVDSQMNKTYRYTNQNALTYNQYEINPDALGLPTLNVNTGRTEAPSSAVVKPQIAILSPASSASYEKADVPFTIMVKQGQGQHTRLFVEINGGQAQEIEPQPTGPAKKGAAVVPSNKYIVTLPTQTPGQDCNVAFFAKDEQGISSETQKRVMRYVGEKPKPFLHLVSIGVGNYPAQDLQKLKYPVKDAKDFISAIAQADLSEYQSIKTKTCLTDQAATRRDILSAIREVSQSAGQNDVVMLFMSGHGVNTVDDTYFMSYDASAANPYDGIDFSTLKSLLRKLTERQIKVVVFMDACHSGAFGKKGSFSLATLQEADIIGYYSSSSSEESAEGENIQNGYFTHALIAGLRGGAAKNGEITASSLQRYIEEDVKTRSKGTQHPTVTNNIGDIKLFNVK